MIVLKSEYLTIKSIIKPTKAEMFKNLKPNDIIQLSVNVKAAGSNKGTYATNIKIKNINTGEVAYKTFNEIEKILERFEFYGEQENMERV